MDFYKQIMHADSEEELERIVENASYSVEDDREYEKIYSFAILRAKAW